MENTANPEKRVHRETTPKNQPSDIQSTPHVPCDFAVGDKVTFTNDYGAAFDNIVMGFAKSPQGLNGERFVYLDSDCWWFPVSPESLVKRDEEVRADDAPAVGGCKI